MCGSQAAPAAGRCSSDGLNFVTVALFQYTQVSVLHVQARVVRRSPGIGMQQVMG
jgi:hypothetical protein